MTPRRRLLLLAPALALGLAACAPQAPQPGEPGSPIPPQDAPGPPPPLMPDTDPIERPT